MGSAAQTGIANSSAEELQEAFKSMSSEDRARFANLVDEASKEAENKPKPPTFEKPPMAVPGISKEWDEPSTRAPVSIAPPVGRPRSADLKKSTSVPVACAQ